MSFRKNQMLYRVVKPTNILQKSHDKILKKILEAFKYVPNWLINQDCLR